MIEFDYSKLKGRIVEKYGSQSALAAEIPISENQLSSYMTGSKRFTTKMIDRIVELLDISPSEIGAFFFTPKVR